MCVWNKCVLPGFPFFAISFFSIFCFGAFFSSFLCNERRNACTCLPLASTTFRILFYDTSISSLICPRGNSSGFIVLYSNNIVLCVIRLLAAPFQFSHRIWYDFSRSFDAARIVWRSPFHLYFICTAPWAIVFARVASVSIFISECWGCRRERRDAHTLQPKRTRAFWHGFHTCVCATAEDGWCMDEMEKVKMPAASASAATMSFVRPKLAFYEARRYPIQSVTLCARRWQWSENEHGASRANTPILPFGLVELLFLYCIITTHVSEDVSAPLVTASYCVHVRILSLCHLTLSSKTCHEIEVVVEVTSLARQRAIPFHFFFFAACATRLNRRNSALFPTVVKWQWQTNSYSGWTKEEEVHVVHTQRTRWKW